MPTIVHDQLLYSSTIFCLLLFPLVFSPNAPRTCDVDLFRNVFAVTILARNLCYTVPMGRLCPIFSPDWRAMVSSLATK